MTPYPESTYLFGILFVPGNWDFVVMMMVMNKFLYLEEQTNIIVWGKGLGLKASNVDTVR